MQQTRSYLLWAGAPDVSARLYEDVRRLVHSYVCDTACTRCGVALETRRGVRACFLRHERLCFTCYHRARWPRA